MQRKYRRFFVILESEELRNDRSQTPKGHAKFEVRNEKGVLSLTCQNLKPFKERNVRYRWYLVNTSKAEPIVVDIGPMDVDDNGKGELTWEFIADNVKASKNEIDSFNIIALLVESIGEKKVFEAPLVGYIEKDTDKIDWRSMIERKLYGEFSIESKRSAGRKQEVKKEEPNFGFELKEEKPLEIKKPIALEQKAVKPVEAKEIPIEQTAKPLEAPMIKPVAEIEQKPLETTKPMPIKEKTALSFEEASDEMPKPLFKPVAELGHTPAIDVNYHIPAIERPQIKDATPKEAVQKDIVQKDTVQVYVEGTLKMFPKIQPFEENLESYQWWQLPYNYQTMYRAYMPFIAYIEGMRYPNYYFPYQYPSEYQRLIYMHQHYIFGAVYDESKRIKYYVYGIPGRRVITDQPYGGTTGFVYWHPSSKEPHEATTHGYWLMHVDAETGKVVTPLETTKL